MNVRAPGQPLRRDEAEARARLLEVTDYRIEFDLTTGAETFTSRTTIRFESLGGGTFVDIKPVELGAVNLNGVAVDTSVWERGRLPLQTRAGDNKLVVEATMRYRNDGEGLHRSVDPADGRVYLYGMSFMDAAPSMFACFDQPDLKAPYTVSVTAPDDWVVFGNGRATQTAPGHWELATTPPLATYFVTIVAGPYVVIRDEHDQIPLSISARASLADQLHAQAPEILAVTKQSFDELHRLFGVRYPFGDYHQAFVPEFNAGAMENPGCVTIRDPLLFTSTPTRGARVWRAALIAHEMAHQWFGNLVTPRWWDDLWLNESFAEYLGNRVAATATEFDDAWVEVAYARRQWGLTADLRSTTHPVAGNGAVDAQAALQDFDGISYAKGSAILRQFNTALGDDAFFSGVRSLFEEHRFGNIALDDVVASWERSAGTDLRSTVHEWLRTAGPDVLTFDRDAGQITRDVPQSSPAQRSHSVSVAYHGTHGWERHPITLASSHTPFAPGPGVVLIDPDQSSWAATPLDRQTVAALPAVLPDVEDPLLRASLWSALRTTLQLGTAAPPVHDSDDTVRRTLAWISSWLLPLAPSTTSARLHESLVAAMAAHPVGSGERRMALWGAIRTATDEAPLRGWLTAPPAGIELDLDLRWRLLRRLASIGATTQAELDAALAAAPGAEAAVAHTRATAAQPTAAAKAYAWARFTGDVDVPNYEVEAAGAGLWSSGTEPGGEALPYLDRYFDELPATAQVRSGWVLASASEAFYPSVISVEVLDRTRTLIAHGDLEPSLVRRLRDQSDDLAYKLAVLDRFPLA